MESNYNRKDFEQFVKQNADQYRMFPSEKVWNNIHNTLHTRRKWYGAGLVILLLSTVTAVTWVMLSYPVSKNKTSNIVSSLQVTNSPEKNASPSAEKIQQVISFEQEKSNHVQKEAPVVQPLFITTIPIATVATPDIIVPHQTQFVAGDKKQLSPSSGTIDNTKFNVAEQEIVTSFIPVDQPTFVTANLNNPIVDDINPLTIESVINAYQIKRTGKKISWQVFFSPTVSYRKLSENKDYYLGNIPGSYPFSASPSDNVNNSVTHKPDLGLEIGLTARYPVTKNMKLRGGLQFNIRRYDIKAFAYRGEMANIDLTGTAGTRAWTYYRTKSGYKANWLKNFYLTVSVPLGAELKLFGNKNTSVGIAGTVQPTYIISDRAYLISTDYKNYAEVPSLIRHVNVNTSFESFISYKTGKTQWQVGPQIRYQLLSSFQTKYPVKENLFDFGLKIGVSLNNQ